MNKRLLRIEEEINNSSGDNRERLSRVNDDVLSESYRIVQVYRKECAWWGEVVRRESQTKRKALARPGNQNGHHHVFREYQVLLTLY